MRADRLVATLLVLQARGRVTARELADELEISVKTARRDLEALAIAGIPVYSQAGRNGGWQLIGGARTDLSGLTENEARTLFMVAGPASTATPAAKAALRKLVQALPETFRAGAERAASSMVLDPASWGAEAVRPPQFLDQLRHAVVAARQVRLGYADRTMAETTRLVHPLGLVEKGATWYLVAGTEKGLRTFRVQPHPRRRGHRRPRRAPGGLRPGRDVARRRRRGGGQTGGRAGAAPHESLRRPGAARPVRTVHARRRGVQRTRRPAATTWRCWSARRRAGASPATWPAGATWSR